MEFGILEGHGTTLLRIPRDDFYFFTSTYFTDEEINPKKEAV